ncbi:MAG TPA: hypothetical protein IGS40_20675 [Trichormus sp. M33_DOE_039]|nr:hypothetical protein [Trichormus sp. M33_DOE_039]
MQLSAGIKNFWISVISYLLVGFCLFLYLVASNGWKLTNLLSLPGFIGLIVVVAVAIFPLLWFLSHLKSQLIKVLPDDVQFNKVVPTDYPWLDLATLSEQTTTLESLGFIQLIDHDIPSALGFSRSLAHPQQYCFAEIGQLFQVTGGIITHHLCIFSILEQDWALAEINKAVSNVDAISYIWRHPKQIRRYHSNMKLDELFQSHLKFRQQILTDLNINLSTDTSWSFFQRIEEQAAIFRKQTMRRKNILLSMLETTLFEMNPKSEWLGDYPKEAAKRRKTCH